MCKYGDTTVSWTFLQGPLQKSLWSLHSSLFPSSFYQKVLCLWPLASEDVLFIDKRLKSAACKISSSMHKFVLEILPYFVLIQSRIDLRIWCAV